MGRTTAPVSDGYDPNDWDEVRAGIGEQIVLAEGESYIGNYLGAVEQEITDKDTGEIRQALAHQFSHPDTPQEIEFMWGSANLDRALSDEIVHLGDMIRVTFVGKESYTDKATKQPRVAKRYRVQAKKV
jgi:hypothetical protein